MRFSKKTVILLSLVITTLAGCCLTVVNWNGRSEAQLKERYELILDCVYETVERELEKPFHISHTMSGDLLLKDLLLEEAEQDDTAFTQKMADYLSAVKNNSTARTAFLVSDASRKYYTYSGLNKIVRPDQDAHDIWYSVFVNSRKDYDYDIDADEVNAGQWTVFVNSRIKDSQGRMLGVCGVGVPMDGLQLILKEYEEKYGVQVSFLDPEGAVQVDTEAVNIEGANLYSLQSGREKDGYSYRNQEGEFVSMRYVDSLGWYLVVHGRAETIPTDQWLPQAVGLALFLAANSMVVLLTDRKRSH